MEEFRMILISGKTVNLSFMMLAEIRHPLNDRLEEDRLS
jgi:hypothetical protein